MEGFLRHLQLIDRVLTSRQQAEMWPWRCIYHKARCFSLSHDEGTFTFHKQWLWSYLVVLKVLSKRWRTEQTGIFLQVLVQINLQLRNQSQHPFEVAKTKSHAHRSLNYSSQICETLTKLFKVCGTTHQSFNSRNHCKTEALCDFWPRAFICNEHSEAKGIFRRAFCLGCVVVVLPDEEMKLLITRKIKSWKNRGSLICWNRLDGDKLFQNLKIVFQIFSPHESWLHNQSLLEIFDANSEDTCWPRVSFKPFLFSLPFCNCFVTKSEGKVTGASWAFCANALWSWRCLHHNESGQSGFLLMRRN